MAVREVDSYLQKNEGQSPTYIIYKNKFKVDKRLKHKSWHHRSLRGEQNFFLRCRQWSKTDCGGDSCTFGGRLIFILLLEFIGVILVNEIIYISSVQFYNTSSVYCMWVCPPPKVKSFSLTIYTAPFTFHYLPMSLPPGNHHSVVCVYEVFCLFICSFSFMCHIWMKSYDSCDKMDGSWEYHAK